MTLPMIMIWTGPGYWTLKGPGAWQKCLYLSHYLLNKSIWIVIQNWIVINHSYRGGQAFTKTKCISIYNVIKSFLYEFFLALKCWNSLHFLQHSFSPNVNTGLTFFCGTEYQRHKLEAQSGKFFLWNHFIPDDRFAYCQEW